MERLRLIYRIAFLMVAVIMASPVIGQVYSNRDVGKKNQAYVDSIKNSEYPYALPIWGQKAAKLGFNLPYSAGLGLNYITQESDLVIENLKVGFNHNELIPLDQVVRFNSAVSKASGLNFRPDIWLLPFLNVYGIIAKSSPSTNVDYSIYAPDQTGTWSEVVRLTSKAEFSATTLGFGLTPTIGVGGGWLALDMNFTWNDIPQLSDPAFAFVFGPRLGKSFKLKQPDRTVAFWAGAFRLKLNTGTSGSLNLKDVMPIDGLQAKVDAGLQKVDQGYTNINNWWNALPPVDQAKPGNIARYETATKALDTAGAFLGNLDTAIQDVQNATVQYSLDKRPKDMWNFIVGAQYQHNKHWMVRFEYGFLGSRTQVITGLQYRFGL